MGTSSSFSGPNQNPLLPDDFDDNSWQNAKTEFGKYINNNGGNSSRLFGKYVKASGGKNNLANSAKGGKSGFINTVNLLNRINNEGFTETLSSFKILAEGKSLQEIFSELVNHIAPSGSSKEESVARQATLETMASFYTFVDEQNIDLEIANSVSGDVLDDFLCEYFVNYITGLLLKDLGYGVEKYVEDPSLLESKEQELRDYVDASIYVMLKKSQLNQNPQKIVDNVFENAFEIVGGYYE